MRQPAVPKNGQAPDAKSGVIGISSAKRKAKRSSAVGWYLPTLQHAPPHAAQMAEPSAASLSDKSVSLSRPTSTSSAPSSFRRSTGRRENSFASSATPRFHRSSSCFILLAGAAHKPGSVPGVDYPAPNDGHSSRTAVTDSLQRPTRKHGRTTLNASLLGLAPGGVYLASTVTSGPGELLPHPFTRTCLRRSFGGRTALCGTIPGVTPAGRYPAPCPVEPGLSSPRQSGRRPSVLLQPNRVTYAAFSS